MADLNTLIPANSLLFLMKALTINARGQIAGFGRLSDGEHRGFLLTPCDDDHHDVESCDYSMVDAADVANNAATPQSPLPIPTMDSLARPTNPSENWFRQRYRLPGQRPALRH